MDDSKLYENKGLNVTFKVHGGLREMLDYAHKEYGVNKSEQAQYLMETLIANELTGENQMDDYLRMIKGLIIRKLRTKQSELEFQISLREEAIQSINIELGDADCQINNDERLLRLKQVLEIIPVSKSSWWAGVKNGRYPASVKYGRSTFWLNSDIQALINHIDDNKLGELK
jgi:predicted DNA-binding transcriptional regulator AlpA|tara:strand:- start:99 stop:614 length:516 start_codon:yes stop_codon:yes gene_type:complete